MNDDFSPPQTILEKVVELWNENPLAAMLVGSVVVFSVASFVNAASSASVARSFRKEAKTRVKLAKLPRK